MTTKNIKKKLESCGIYLNDYDLDIVMMKYHEVIDFYNKIKKTKITKNYGNFNSFMVIFYISNLYLNNKLHLLSYLPIFLIEFKNQNNKTLDNTINNINLIEYRKGDNSYLIDSVDYEDDLMTIYDNTLYKEIIVSFYDTLRQLENDFNVFSYDFYLLNEFIESFFIYIIFNDKNNNLDKINNLLDSIKNNSHLFLERIFLNDISNNIYEYLDCYFSNNNKKLIK